MSGAPFSAFFFTTVAWIDYKHMPIPISACAGRDQTFLKQLNRKQMSIWNEELQSKVNDFNEAKRLYITRQKDYT